MDVKDYSGSEVWENINKDHLRISFTGRRPKDLCGYDPSKYENFVRHDMQQMLTEIVDANKNASSIEFISGGAQGFDQLAFNAVHIFKRSHPGLNIKNTVYVPYEGQENIWPEDTLFGQKHYRAMLNSADEVNTLRGPITHEEVDAKIGDDNKKFDSAARKKAQWSIAAKALYGRNHAMVNASDFVIALYPDDTWKDNKGGTSECMRYAFDHGVPIMQMRYNTAGAGNSLNLLDIVSITKEAQIDKDGIMRNTDIFTLPSKETDALLVTTNGVIKKNGEAVMGAGIAKAVNDRYHVAGKLAEHISRNGNIPCDLGVYDGFHIISFPTKHNWRDDSDLDLIKASAERIVHMADELGLKRLYTVPPGCSNGNLDWTSQVKPVVDSIFDDRFVVVSNEPAVVRDQSLCDLPLNDDVAFNAIESQEMPLDVQEAQYYEFVNSNNDISVDDLIRHEDALLSASTDDVIPFENVDGYFPDQNEDQQNDQNVWSDSDGIYDDISFI